MIIPYIIPIHHLGVSIDSTSWTSFSGYAVEPHFKWEPSKDDIESICPLPAPTIDFNQYQRQHQYDLIPSSETTFTQHPKSILWAWEESPNSSPSSGTGPYSTRIHLLFTIPFTPTSTSIKLRYKFRHQFREKVRELIIALTGTGR